MKPIIFQYRLRQLHTDDIASIKAFIAQHSHRGRSYISRELCKGWNWVQPNGKLKEYAARDLLLRLEEQGLVALPPRICQKNNLKPKVFEQIPLFTKKVLEGTITGYENLTIQVVKDPQESYLWSYLLHHYHYLGNPKLVGEHIRHIVRIGNQVGLKAPAIRQPIGFVLVKPKGAPNGAISISTMDNRRNSTCILSTEISGGLTQAWKSLAILLEPQYKLYWEKSCHKRRLARRRNRVAVERENPLVVVFYHQNPLLLHHNTESGVAGHKKVLRHTVQGCPDL